MRVKTPRRVLFLRSTRYTRNTEAVSGTNPRIGVAGWAARLVIF